MTSLSLSALSKKLNASIYPKGKYSAEVKTVTTTLERNRVAVRFEIEEGNRG